MIFQVYNGISLQPYWGLCCIHMADIGIILDEKYRNFDENTETFVYTDNIIIDRSNMRMYNRVMSP